MKRKIYWGVTAITIILCLFLCGCSAFTGIHTAYEKEGYEEIDSAAFRQQIEAVTGDGFGESFVSHVFAKESENPENGQRPSAIILEFPTEDALIVFVEASQPLREFFGDISATDRICGNCLLVYAESEAEELLFIYSK